MQKWYNQSSKGWIEMSKVSISCATSMISNLSMVTTGRMIGVLVTTLIALHALEGLAGLLDPDFPPIDDNQNHFVPHEYDR